MINEKVILVTNDDGIKSPGIKATVEAVYGLGKIIVIAPAEQQTSAGRSLKGSKNETLIPYDFEINGNKIEAYSCKSTPALAVAHGLNVLFHDKFPDLVVSGINFGENLGTNCTISGTVGAAIEAATNGIKSIAVSRQTKIEHHHEYADLDWEGSKYFLRKFAELYLENEMPFDVDIIKIDVPAEADETTEWRLTKVSRQPYYIAIQENPEPETKIGDAEIIIKFNEEKLENDSDIKAVYYDKLVSVSPLSINLTSRTDFDSLNKEFKKAEETEFKI